MQITKIFTHFLCGILFILEYSDCLGYHEGYSSSLHKMYKFKYINILLIFTQTINIYFNLQN